MRNTNTKGDNVQKKSLIYLAKILILIVAVLIIDNVIGFFIEPVKYSDYFKHDPVYKAAKADGSDLILIGGSHMEMCMNPSIFEEELGYKNVLNVSATDQPIKGMYYYLRQLVNEIHPKCIVMDVTNQSLYRPEVLMGKLNILDKMSFPYKVLYYINDKELVKNSATLLRSYRFKDFFFGCSQAKKYEISKAGYPESEGYEYGGFERTYTMFYEGGIPFDNYLSDDSSNEMLPESLEYILKIKSLCDNNGIDFYIVSCPISLVSIYGTPDYERRANDFTKWASDNGIIYRNLSMIKNREAIIGDKMWDSGHVSGDCADDVSRIYAQILLKDRNKEALGSEYLYENVEQLKSDVHRVVSVNANIVKDDNNVELHIESLHNADINPVYHVTAQSIAMDNVVMDWCNDDFVNVNASDFPANTYFIVEAKTSIDSNDEIVAKQIYICP